MRHAPGILVAAVALVLWPAILPSFTPTGPFDVGGVALAVQPDEVLADPGLETRARTISAGLRCLVCQNQSIDDSDAPLAKDLRLVVRDRLQAGDSDGAVEDYVVARYGDFVLLKPRFRPSTLLLWGTPILLLLGGGAYAVRAARRTRPTQRRTTLNADEEAAVETLLRERGF